MKVTSVEPGAVFPEMTGTWSYWYLVNGEKVFAKREDFDSANHAKQDMRETVARERKRHCVGG